MSIVLAFAGIIAIKFILVNLIGSGMRRVTNSQGDTNGKTQERRLGSGRR
jgi:hypothetical protein